MFSGWKPALCVEQRTWCLASQGALNRLITAGKKETSQTGCLNLHLGSINYVVGMSGSRVAERLGNWDGNQRVAGWILKLCCVFTCLRGNNVSPTIILPPPGRSSSFCKK